MEAELIATYYINHAEYDVYALYKCWDDYDNKKVAYYEVYDSDKNCLNNGNTYYDFPTYNNIYNFVMNSFAKGTK